MDNDTLALRKAQRRNRIFFGRMRAYGVLGYQKEELKGVAHFSYSGGPPIPGGSQGLHDPLVAVTLTGLNGLEQITNTADLSTISGILASSPLATTVPTEPLDEGLYKRLIEYTLGRIKAPIGSPKGRSRESYTQQNTLSFEYPI